MPIFSYTVANKEGKQLNGNVEAADETTARNELNNLGFSILTLTENPNAEIHDSTLNKFVFEAIDKNSRLITGTIPAKTEEEGLTKLTTEYNLTVTAIWNEHATEAEISEARKKAPHLQAFIKSDNENLKQAPKSVEDTKKEEFIKSKIEYILKEVGDLLKNFEEEIDLDQKAEINKRIDKILRIKNSTNLDYIQSTAEELLLFIQKQEESLRQKGKNDKEFELKIKTRELLDNLNKGQHKKTLSEDISERITGWYLKHIAQNPNPHFWERLLATIFVSIKSLFEVPPEVIVLKENIKAYNQQIIEFIKIYFKEPTKEYKEKAKNTIKTIWAKRKEAKNQIKEIYKNKKLQKNETEKIPQEHFGISFIEEVNTFTGWLLAFYVAYYFIALYLTTKNFGITTPPTAFFIYKSHIFKYLLVTIFLLHSATALKVNFFKKSKAANFVLPPLFIFLTLISLLNF